MAAFPWYVNALKAATQDNSGIVVANLKGIRVACASSYLVHQRSLPRLLNHLKSELKRGPRWPVDGTYNALVQTGQITAGVVIPFITGTTADALQSDIQINFKKDFYQILLLVRSLFRLGIDKQALVREIRFHLEQTKGKYVFLEGFDIKLDKLLS